MKDLVTLNRNLVLLARESVNSGLLFDLAKLDSEIAELTSKSEEADFWNNRNAALEIIAKLNHSRDIVETYRALLNGHHDLEELLAFEDDSFLEQIESSLEELKKEAKAADKIWLATDEDREGESISWHLCEVLGLPKDTARITFHEITKPALDEAIKNPRTVDMDMVSSQQARQTLDMLVGYDLSDMVRRKVPGAISAGRLFFLISVIYATSSLPASISREKMILSFSGT